MIPAAMNNEDTGIIPLSLREEIVIPPLNPIHHLETSMSSPPTNSCEEYDNSGLPLRNLEVDSKSYSDVGSNVMKGCEAQN